MSLCVDVIVKSTAYDIMFMLVGMRGSVVHVDVKECGGQNRALGGLLRKSLVCELAIE